MKSLCFLAALVGCVVAAVEPLPEPPVPRQALVSAVENRSLEKDYFMAESRQPEHDLSRLGSLAEYAFDPASPMPEAPQGHSAVVADGGLLFDNTRSSLSYIGNVRMKDERVQLRAAHRLYIRLPEKSEASSSQPAKSAPQADPKPQPASGSAAKPSAAKPAPAVKPAPVVTVQPEQKQPEPPTLVLAENAAIDVRDSKFLLEGRNQLPSLSLTRGADSVTLNCSPGGSPATIFGSSQGDVLLQGAQIVFIWHDAQGNEWKLVCAAGPVYYKASDRCLVAMGESQLSSPRYTMHTKRALYIVFMPDEEAEAALASAKKKTEPFSQFSAVRLKDVEYVNAYGDVRLTAAPEGDAPASSVLGEALHYVAATGECRVVGDPCSLAFGDNTLDARGAIELQGDGSAVIRSASVSGFYERPFATTSQGGETIRGRYSAPGPVTYDVQRNCVVLPAGISAQDAHGFFRCSGKVEAFLAAQEGAQAPKPPREGMRMPNLAIARQSGVSRISAEGQVRMHSDASATTAACDVSCDSLEADLGTAKATLRAAAGRHAQVHYSGHKLTAFSSARVAAEVNLLENGDLLVTGEKVHASMPGEKGLTTVDCTRSLRLEREKNLLTLGPNSCIRTPDGILTARAPLLAELAESDAPAKPLSKYPHLVYNYSGLRRADTTGGGTLRTPQASMQCEGAIALELKPGAQMSNASGDARSAIKSASAQKLVQVAGKDATGRLVRAVGDRLDFEPSSGNFCLRGKSVTLVDEFNTHTASGRGACITIDPDNNVHITGENHITTATQVQKQMDNQKKKK